MSIRYITHQQFSDGTTIDGNRLEEALQKLEELSDGVPLSAVKNPFHAKPACLWLQPYP